MRKHGNFFISQKLADDKRRVARSVVMIQHKSVLPLFLPFSSPDELFRALDIPRIINLLYARIISLIFDTISSVVEVDGRPERCSSSVESAPPRERSNHLHTAFRLTAASP
jgi:hypothetical protein